MIISLLGTSVFKTKSKYTNSTDIKIKEGEYINSTHAFLESFENEKFIFLGTKEAIDKHKENEIFILLFESRDVQFIEIENNLQDIFLKIMTIFLDNDRNIIFDITHSFRDAVIMSVISTIVTQTLDFKNSIRMTFAKEVERAKEYNYELVGQDILNTANISFLVTTFLSTLKVPQLNLNDDLYNYLADFSNHLVSNQFKTIYEKDIPQLKKYIKTNEDILFFIKPLLKELLEMLKQIEKTKKKENYEKFLFFAKFFLEKDYFLHSSTYLIESISLYVEKVLKELNYANFDISEYKRQQLIIDFFRLNYKNENFKFPHHNFLNDNANIIKEYENIKRNVARIRNSLAHINVNREYKNIKKELRKNLNALQTLIKNKSLETNLINKPLFKDGKIKLNSF